MPVRFLTAGESHGRAIVTILEGIPANLKVSKEYINVELQRRQRGYGRGGRMKIEKDEVEILSGVRFGKTIGSPIALLIWNKDWENWAEKMAVEGEKGESTVPFTRPRPGHADLAGGIKYNQRDLRNVLERASARETAARVAVGAVCKRFLEEFGIKAEITGRFKHIYGIYNKMRTQNLEFEQVHDVIAFRIITSSLRECYEALGAVHSTWKPVPGRFKDYIALPKSNGYQSLHTTVIGPFGERMEIQIRTQRMHEVAEYGIAAHWKYKEGRIESSEIDKIYASLRQLLEWKDIKDPAEFLEAIKGDLIPNMVYVFTPRGDLKELPSGSTPVDFAYAIHTEVGNHCTGARVNGRIVPLDYQLQSGDIVEIITASDKHPSRDWLKFVVTSRAKTKIRSWLRNEEREQSKLVGKSICERKFKQYGLDFQKMLKSGELESVMSELKFKDVDDLYLAVGFGKISVAEILKRVVPKGSLEKSPEKESRIQKIINTIIRSTKSGVLVRGYDDVLIRFANCCSPLPGEAIVGYITRGRGITIHKQNCSQLLDIDPARKIEVEWDKNFKGLRPARISVVCADRPGMLSSITRSIALSDVNISKAEIHSTDSDRAIGTFEIAVTDLNQLEGVINSIKKVKGVISVERVYGGD